MTASRLLWGSLIFGRTGFFEFEHEPRVMRRWWVGLIVLIGIGGLLIWLARDSLAG